MEGIGIMGFVKIAIHGNLVADPEARQTRSGDAVTNFTVACDVYAGRNAPPKVLYVRVSAFRGLGDTCRQYLKKGQGVILWGKADVHAWNDSRDGSPRAALELEAEGMDFAGKPRGDAQAEPEGMTQQDDDELPFGEG